jgi:hypothetical protein
MNIFVTNICPFMSAAGLDDKRVNKMVLESAQMLSTAIHLVDSEQISIFKVFTPKGKKRKLALHRKYGRVYMPTHANHPCNVWTRKNRTNYNWLVNHFDGLLRTYTIRSGKTHACSTMLNTFKSAAELFDESETKIEFVNCAARDDMGINFKHVTPVTEAYRQYLNARFPNDKLKPKWTNQIKLHWITYKEQDEGSKVLFVR